MPSNAFIFQSPADFPDLITLSNPTIGSNIEFSGNVLFIFNEAGFQKDVDRERHLAHESHLFGINLKLDISLMISTPIYSIAAVMLKIG